MFSLFFTLSSVFSLLFFLSYMVLVAVIFFLKMVSESFNEKYEGYLLIGDISNGSDHLLRFLIPSLVVILLIKTFQRLVKKTKKLTADNKRAEKALIDGINGEIQRYEKAPMYDIKFTSKSTYLSGKKIYLSLRDLVHFKKNETNYLFKIFHEIYHGYIYDNSIGYVNSILVQILKISILIVYTAIIGNYFSESIYRPIMLKFIPESMVSEFILLVFIYLIYCCLYKFLSNILSSPQYFKECLCDRFSAIVFKRNSLPIPIDVFPDKRSEKHPSKAERILCSKGGIVYDVNFMYTYVGLLFFSYFPTIDNEVYRNLNSYLLFFSLSALLAIIVYISNRTYIYYYAMSSIFLGAILVYVKSKVYYIWFYGYILSPSNIDYGLHVSLENTFHHIFFFVSISLLGLAISKGVKNIE